MQRMKLSIVGTGNVAFQLGSLLKNAGIDFCEVYGRSTENTLELAKRLQCNVVDSLSKITSDIVLVCISDDALSEVLPIIAKDKKVIYTSGSIHLNTCGRTSNTGVLYPLQTLKKERALSTTNLPLLIEAQGEDLLKEINLLANCLSNNVHVVSSDDRLYYHLSAVWMNNFTTHLVYLSEQLLQTRKLNFDLLKPLLVETAEKLKQGNIKSSQTGPASRGDKRILELHESLLSGKQRLLYELLSDSISETYRKDDQL
jgi:predicted short-subunit dehydrogenase-like oxidoreductase (DUF2520 family)